MMYRCPGDESLPVFFTVATTVCVNGLRKETRVINKEGIFGTVSTLDAPLASDSTFGGLSLSYQPPPISCMWQRPSANQFALPLRRCVDHHSADWRGNERL